MKRKLLVFACAVCIALTGIVSNAAEAETDTKNERFVLLETMGIIENTADDTELTRGMLAEIAAKMINMGNETIGDEDIPFSDVHPLSENASSIMVVYRMGIMTGENGEFRPSEAATLHETVKVMACVAGYGEYAASRGGYPAGYIEAAQSAGILKGISLSAADTLSVNDAAALADNTLHTDIMRQVTFGNSSEYKTEKNYTVLKHYFDISNIKGLVEANEYTAVYSESVKSKSGSVIIDGTEYDTGVSDVAAYLGCWVEAYVHHDKSNDEYTVVYVSVPENKNNVKTVEADDIDNVNCGQYITYTENDKTERLKINATTNVIYNGMFYNKAHNTENDILMPESGSLTLFDSNYDDVYDIIMVESYEYVIAEGINKTDGIIIDRYGTNHIIAEAGSGVEVTVYRGRTLSSYDTVKAGELLEVKRSADNMLVYINIPGVVISGTVTAEGEESIEIDGTEYAILDTIIGDSFTVGTEGDFYLNTKGYIAAVETEIRQTGYGYGLLIDAKLSDGVGGTPEMKIFTQNNEMCIFEAELKIVYNEKSGQETEGIIDSLTEEGEFKRRLVSYKLNGSGKVSALTVIDKATVPEETENYDVGGLNLRYKNTGTLGMAQASITDECVFFIVPPEDSDDESYEAGSRDKLAHDKMYTAYMYDTDDYLTPGVILIYDTSIWVDTDNDVILIEKIRPAIVDDETVMQIVGGSNAAVTDKYWYDPEDTTIPKMESGDIVQITAASDNKVRSVRMLKNASTQYFYGIGEGGGSLYYAYGKVAKLDVSKGICIINIGTEETPDLRVCMLGNTKGYKYNKETGKVTVVSALSEISLNQEIYVRERYQEPKEFVIFE